MNSSTARQTGCVSTKELVGSDGQQDPVKEDLGPFGGGIRCAKIRLVGKASRMLGGSDDGIEQEADGDDGGNGELHGVC